MYLNIWVGIGNVVADPQLQTSAAGRLWTKFTIVCNEFYYDDNGKLQQVPTFVDIVARDSWAERICRHVKKGQQLQVKGPLRIKFYNDERNNGLRRKNVQIEGYHFSWDPVKDKKTTQEDAVIEGLEGITQ
jgi:single-stranded DNA-binding protein